MPYITAELWQRPPRRPEDKTRTVCKAAFPVYQSKFDNTKAEQNYDLVFQIVKATRSLLVEYNIKENGDIYLLTKDAETAKSITNEVSSIKALVGKSLNTVTPTLNASELPDGLTANVVSEACTVYLMVKGRIDVDTEISKTQKKIAKLEAAREKLEKAMAVKDYQTKVKAEVQQADAERLVAYKEETKTLDELIAKFEDLRA